MPHTKCRSYLKQFKMVHNPKDHSEKPGGSFYPQNPVVCYREDDAVCSIYTSTTRTNTIIGSTKIDSYLGLHNLWYMYRYLQSVDH